MHWTALTLQRGHAVMLHQKSLENRLQQQGMQPRLQGCCTTCWSGKRALTSRERVFGRRRWAPAAGLPPPTPCRRPHSGLRSSPSSEGSGALRCRVTRLGPACQGVQPQSVSGSCL